MTEETHDIQKQQQAEIQKRLWAIANDLRGNMDPSEFKNYILGFIFYRFLSNKVENYVNKLLKNDGVSYEEAWEDEEFQGELKDALIKDIGYLIEPEYLFSNFIKKINAGKFDIEELQKAINAVENSTIGAESEGDFVGLFADLNLQSPSLGLTVADRGNLVSKILLQLSDIPFEQEDLEIDVLGDAYEYLIGQFAANAGKKAGEFYTPQQVSKLLARIVTLGKNELPKVYDPTMGSGSLLLQVGDAVGKEHVGNFFGQELNRTTYNLARMNMIMHGINYRNFDFELGDTLEHDMFPDLKADAVVANPPYSAKWDTTDKLDDPRFKKYGKTSPKSKADFAFVEHMLYHLKDDGTMAVVLPHGVLFRGAAEGVIRKYMTEQDNVLDAVIGLPANLFYGTSIPTVVLVFKKNRTNKDIFFIDASKEFEKGKNQNILTDENIDKIVKTYSERKDIEKYAHDADFDEIQENEFNLNIPRYVDTFEEEPPVDIKKVSQELQDINKKIKETESEFLSMVDELQVTDESKGIIEAIKEAFKIMTKADKEGKERRQFFVLRDLLMIGSSVSYKTKFNFFQD